MGKIWGFIKKAWQGVAKFTQEVWKVFKANKIAGFCCLILICLFVFSEQIEVELNNFFARQYEANVAQLQKKVTRLEKEADQSRQEAKQGRQKVNRLQEELDAADSKRGKDLLGSLLWWSIFPVAIFLLFPALSVFYGKKEWLPGLLKEKDRILTVAVVICLLLFTHSNFGWLEKIPVVGEWLKGVPHQQVKVVIIKQDKLIDDSIPPIKLKAGKESSDTILIENNQVLKFKVLQGGKIFYWKNGKKWERLYDGQRLKIRNGGTVRFKGGELNSLVKVKIYEVEIIQKEVKKQK